jgi:outer membrane scaffolding protein for murein synthesis (MipA/OmpV family)
LRPITRRTHLEIRQAVNGNRGLEANLSIDGVYRVGPWTFSAGPRVGYGDGTFMNAYYSVTPFEAIVNGRISAYYATAGIDKVGALLTARYEFNRSWSTTVYGGYDRLVGSAGYSPIPNQLGSRDEFKGGAMVSYTFAWGGLGILGF